MNILEIGCGDGGNLLPFTELGCNTTGVDLSAGRIKDAILFFEERQIKGNFIASDIFKLKGLEHKFDLIICHAGNDIKIIPLGLMYLGRFDKNVALSFICSITS